MVLQTAKVTFHYHYDYLEALAVLKEMLTGSGLERYIGEQLNPDFLPKRPSGINLINNNDPWWFDGTALKPIRRRI